MTILQDPLRYRLFDEDIRRCLTRVFPYATSSRILCSSLQSRTSAESRATGGSASP